MLTNINAGRSPGFQGNYWLKFATTQAATRARQAIEKFDGVNKTPAAGVWQKANKVIVETIEKQNCPKDQRVLSEGISAANSANGKKRNGNVKGARQSRRV